MGNFYSGYKSSENPEKSVISENMMTKTPKTHHLSPQGSPNLIREGSRTAGSGRVAAVIE